MDSTNRQKMYLPRNSYSYGEAQNYSEVKISQSFSSQDADDVFYLRDVVINIKVDKLALNGNPMISDYFDGRLLFNPKHEASDIFQIEFKQKSNSKNSKLKKFYRLEFLSTRTKIKRLGMRKFELQFEKYMSIMSDSSMFKSKESIDNSIIFPKKNFAGAQGGNSKGTMHSLVLRFHEREISRLNNYFKAYRLNIPKANGQTLKMKIKYESARYLKDPNEPGTRKKIENYEKKIEKAKKEKILKGLKEIPYPRFWALQGGSKSSVRKGENGLLKRVKQTTEFPDHPLSLIHIPSPRDLSTSRMPSSA